LIDADKLLIADATSGRLGHRAMVRKLTVGRLPAMVFVGRLPHGPPGTPSAFQVALSHAWPSLPNRSARAQ